MKLSLVAFVILVLLNFGSLIWKEAFIIIVTINILWFIIGMGVAYIWEGQDED